MSEPLSHAQDLPFTLVIHGSVEGVPLSLFANWARTHRQLEVVCLVPPGEASPTPPVAAGLAAWLAMDTDNTDTLQRACQALLTLTRGRTLVLSSAARAEQAGSLMAWVKELPALAATAARGEGAGALTLEPSDEGEGGAVALPRGAFESLYPQATAGDLDLATMVRRLSRTQASPRPATTIEVHDITVLFADAGGKNTPGCINLVPPGHAGEIEVDWLRDEPVSLPLADDSLVRIQLDHVFDQVQDAHGWLQAFYRVAQPNAQLQIQVFHGDGPSAWRRPQQRRAWYEGSFSHFAQPALAESSLDDYHADWQLTEVRQIPCEIGESGNPVALVATLVAIKPARARGKGLLVADAPAPPRAGNDRPGPVATPRSRTSSGAPALVGVGVGRQTIHVHCGNHNNSAGISDTVRFLKFAIEDCGHTACISHVIVPGHINIVLEHFVDEHHLVSMANGLRDGARLILVGTEPITGNTFNGGLVQDDIHYANAPYWQERFDAFKLIACHAEAIWVLDESMVQAYQALVPTLPVRFLPHGHVNDYTSVRQRPEAEKDIDFYFSGSMTTHRQKILAQLSKHHHVICHDKSTPEYLRCDWISRAKVCLGLRLSERNEIPSVSRMHFHLQNRSFLLHETCKQTSPLDRFVFQAAAGEVVDWAEAALGLPNRRHLADAAHESFKARLPMTAILPALLDEVLMRRPAAHQRMVLAEAA